jgi:uncharacterized membrane protein
MRPSLAIKSGPPALKLVRLNALSDGVAAIVLTLLVFGIKVPTEHSFSVSGLRSFLFKIEYEVTVYIVSFVLIGTYWIVQSVMFYYFRHGSRALTWLNLQFLFFLTLLPFVTQLIGTYRHEPKVMVVYGVVNTACCLSLAIVWWYANHIAPVVWPRIDPAAVHSMSLRILLGAVLSLVAIGVSFVNVRLSHVVFLCMPLLHLSHRRVDTHLAEVIDRDEEGNLVAP